MTMRLLMEVWLIAQAAVALMLIAGSLYALGRWLGECIVAWVEDVVARP
jgi:hypothetical protein